MYAMRGKNRIQKAQGEQNEACARKEYNDHDELWTYDSCVTGDFGFCDGLPKVVFVAGWRG
jgi:hypothetical protein